MKHDSLRYRSEAFVLALFLLLFPFVARAQAPEKNDHASVRSTPSVTGTPSFGVVNVNSVTSWIGASGSSNHTPTGQDGFRFPRNTGAVVYQDGIVWGAKIFSGGYEGVGTPVDTQVIRAGGGTWPGGISTTAGYISGLGASAVAVSPSDPAARVYRIRRDYRSMRPEELTRDAADVNEISDDAVTAAQRDSVKAQYERDWSGWPVDLGAPYIERNGTPGYQAPPPFDSSFTADSLFGKYDEPGVAGDDPDTPADQVLWTVYNDLDTAVSRKLAGSLPLGLEIKKTVWAYKPGTLDNLYFTRHQITNKGGVDTSAAAGDQKGSFWLDSMYIAQWADVEIGTFSDDLIGCDSTLGIGFAYNGNATDLVFNNFGIPPSAVVYRLLAGPIEYVWDPADTAYYGFHRITGYRSRGMTGFSYFASATSYNEPPFNDYESGAGGWWKVLRGYAPNGTFTDPDENYGSPGSPFTRFQLNGDPVAGTGNLDGLGTPDSPPPGDRRMVLAMGPIRLAPGESNEFILAVAAGNGTGLTSLTLAKSATDTAKQMLDSGFRSVVTKSERGVAREMPVRFDLLQNYPNPFNPETEVRYQIPEVRGQTSDVSNVKLRVYDLLGRVVATLVDEQLPAGTHRAVWNAGKHPSGIYFLRLESGGLVETRKMILIR